MVMAQLSAAAAPDTQAVRDLQDLSRADVAFAGGKGANLGELTAAGTARAGATGVR